MRTRFKVATPSAPSVPQAASQSQRIATKPITFAKNTSHAGSTPGRNGSSSNNGKSSASKSPKKTSRKDSRSSSEEEDEDDEDLLDDDELITQLREENVKLKERLQIASQQIEKLMLQLQESEQEKQQQNAKMMEKYETLVRTLRTEKDALPVLLRDLVFAATMPPQTRYYSEELIAFCKNIYAKHPDTYEFMRMKGIVFPDHNDLEGIQKRIVNGASNETDASRSIPPSPASIPTSDSTSTGVSGQKPSTSSKVTKAPKPEVRYVNPAQALQKIAEEKNRPKTPKTPKTAQKKRKARDEEDSAEEETTEESDQASFKSDPSDGNDNGGGSSSASSWGSEVGPKKKPSPKQKRVVQRFTPEQKAVLLKSFENNSDPPNPERLKELAAQTQCEGKRIMTWFNNQRRHIPKLPRLWIFGGEDDAEVSAEWIAHLSSF